MTVARSTACGLNAFSVAGPALLIVAEPAAASRLTVYQGLPWARSPCSSASAAIAMPPAMPPFTPVE